MPAMAKLTTNPQGNKEAGHAKDSHETAARLTDNTHGWKEGNQKGLASRKPDGDKISEKRVAKAGKNPTLSPTLAMADRTNNLQGNHGPLHAEKSRTSKAQSNDDAREAQNGKKQGPASPNPRCNNIANKKMGDRVKKGRQSNAEWSAAVRARIEKNRARGKPLPKRGGVTKDMAREVMVDVVAGVKKVIDTGKAFCCAPEPFDVDAYVLNLPIPTRSEPTATLWAKVEV